jgi:hypothetical protein
VHTSGLRVYGEEIFADRGVNAGGRRVTNVAAPTADADAATKKYVDDAVAEAEGAPGERGPRGFPGADGQNGQSIVGPAGPAGTTSWGGLTDMPAWVFKFSYSDIGQFMDPAEQSNFHVVASDSLTPSANSSFNLGHDVRRWRFGFSSWCACQVSSRITKTRPFRTTSCGHMWRKTPGGLTCLGAPDGQTISAW